MWSIDDNAVDVLRRLGEDVTDEQLERAARPRRPSTSPRSSTPRARPAAPRAACSPTATSCSSWASPSTSSTSSSAATRAPPPCSSCRWRTCSRGSSRSAASSAGPDGPQLRHHAPGREPRQFRPTFVLAVPRVFEKVFNTASQRATADGRARSSTGRRRPRSPGRAACDRGRPSLAVRAQHAVFARLVYARLRDALGGRCEYAISGGAPLGRAARPLLPRHRAHRARGLRPHRDHRRRSRSTCPTRPRSAPSAGRCRAPPSGSPTTASCCCRGGQVFAGYWNDEDATAEVLERDGWFHTGDVGEVDDEGFVRITGRKKEILVTAGGKNVAPAVLEDRLRAHPLVEPVHGRRRRPAVHRRAGHPRRRARPRSGPSAHGKSEHASRDLVDDPELRAEIERGGRRGQQGRSPRPSRSASSPSWRRTGPRRAASSRPASSSSAAW